MGRTAGRMVMFDIHKMDRYAPKFIKTIQTIIAGGFDVDYISDAFIKTTRCENTELVTSGGTHYKALVVPAARLMPAATLKKLVSLARQGATVVFVGPISRGRARIQPAGKEPESLCFCLS